MRHVIGRTSALGTPGTAPNRWNSLALIPAVLLSCFAGTALGHHEYITALIMVIGAAGLALAGLVFVTYSMWAYKRAHPFQLP